MWTANRPPIQHHDQTGATFQKLNSLTSIKHFQQFDSRPKAAGNLLLGRGKPDRVKLSSQALLV